jgi:lysophospholipase L1-like esterase
MITAKKLQVLAFGDSLTWGAIPGGKGRHAYEDRWTSALQQALPQLHIVVEGLGGRTSSFDDYASVSERNGVKSLPMLLGSHYPLDLVTIMLGSNDLKPHICGHAQGAAAGIQRLIEIVQYFPYNYGAKAPKILVMSPPLFCNMRDGGPSGGRVIAESEKLAAAYQAVAQKTGCAFFDAAGFAQASVEDGVHLDVENSRAIGQAVAPVIAGFLHLDL